MCMDLPLGQQMQPFPIIDVSCTPGHVSQEIYVGGETDWVNQALAAMSVNGGSGRGARLCLIRRFGESSKDDMSLIVLRMASLSYRIYDVISLIVVGCYRA